MAFYDSSSMFGAPRPKTVVLPELPKPAKLYARALSGVIKGFQRNRPTDLPALRLVRPAVSLDSVAIERYARVCGFFPSKAFRLRFRICSRFRCICCC
jgi:hypothetical protein